MITASISIRWWKRSKAPPVRFIVLRGLMKAVSVVWTCLNIFQKSFQITHGDGEFHMGLLQPSPAVAELRTETGSLPLARGRSMLRPLLSLAMDKLENYENYHIEAMPMPVAIQRSDNSGCFSYLGMDQYLLIPFLMGWTSIYQLFWGSLGTRVLTHPHFSLHVTCNAPASLGTCREQCSALTVKTNPDLRSPGIFHIWEPLKWPRIMQHHATSLKQIESFNVIQYHSSYRNIPFQGAACASRIHEVIGCHWW